MYADLRAVNPKAAPVVKDPAPHIGVCCPRRAGKTYMGALLALITGELKPGSISLIISLNLKQLRRLYWAGGPSGLFTIARKYGLNLEFHNTYLRWEHENGSIGYLLGAEDDEQLEVIRGLEADLYLIDECKSFAPGRLRTMIDDIIDPQRSSRDGRVVLIGTPGHIFAGPFYEATCPQSLDSQGRKYLVPFGEKDPHGRDVIEDMLWSFHTWTLQDNTAKPNQWRDALRKKRAKGWADDHPTWCREYLGQWTTGAGGLVFRYYQDKSTGRVTWQPQPSLGNAAGLPAEGAPWRFVAGLDIGFEAPTAFVVAAYSQRLKQLRHVYDASRTHMLVPDIAEMIHEAIDTYGPIEVIYADVGNLGKMVVATLIREHGFPMERADKREKFDYIELLNGAFSRGEVLIIENTVLEQQLLTNAWDLGDDGENVVINGRTLDKKEQLARLGKLREDKNIPNDSTDALLYLYRGSLHHFGMAQADDGPPIGSIAWLVKQRHEELKRYRERLRQLQKAQPQAVFKSAPGFIREALGRQWKIPSTPQNSLKF